MPTIVEDQYQFLLGYSILWTGTDKDIAVPLIESIQQRYSELRGCSFDRGFYSPSVRDDLDTCLEVHAMPKKGAVYEKRKEAAKYPGIQESTASTFGRGICSKQSGSPRMVLGA